jgi:hypothetical protein
MVAAMELGIEEGSRGFGGEEPGTMRLGVALIGGPIGVFMDVEAGPVVEAGTATGFFGDLEAERMDEVERGSRGDAGAADVAGVVGDLGFEEDDVEERIARGLWRMLVHAGITSCVR